MRRSFLHNILIIVLESHAKWTRERTLRKSSFSESQLQNSLWELYNIGLIKIKCTLKSSSWISNGTFSIHNESEVDTALMNQNAFIYSIRSSDLCKKIFKEKTVELSPNLVLIKGEIKKIIGDSQIKEEKPLNDRINLIRSKLEGIERLANNLSDEELFNHFSLVKQPNVLLEVVKFMIEMIKIIEKGNIKFTHELIESANISPENRSKYRTLTKQVLNYPLIVFNTFRNRIYGDSNIIVSSEIFQLIIFLEDNLRDLIVEKLTPKGWNSSYHLWKILPESIKKGSASQRTFKKNKIPKSKEEKEKLVNNKFNDPIECLRAILVNSYFSDLGKIVSTTSLHNKFFYNVFPDLERLKRAFTNLNSLRNKIMHSHIPSDDIISLGLSGAFEILTGLYTSKPNLILTPI